MFTTFHHTAPMMCVRYRIYGSIMYRDTPTMAAVTLVHAHFPLSQTVQIKYELFPLLVLLSSAQTLLCSLDFVELLSTSPRYLHEASPPRQYQNMLDIVRKVCPEELTLLLGRIIHIVGSSKFESNNSKGKSLGL